MRKSTAAVWEAVHAERRRLAADLSPLRAEQWEVPSLCPGWSVHDVLAHLVDTARTGRVGFVRGMLGARLNFDRLPLGLVGSYPEPAVVQALAYQVRTPVAFGGGRERAAGLRLVDRRTGTAWGAGTEIEADALDLLLTVSGRPVELDPPG
ncbi:maleylpyruvate isomerase family mycothiol-dependent enzyme [Arthrobacter sp. zg-Y238]|uniref:maleylpyruvate isomerase family mycothiol-dependent enzyme n=1 Tax=Arthrobacter sp. zg-Y238 TaxID=2964614 RepID=UPI002102BC91|nr:maleylpyruvate isomerase family mycothiol-dependent enzyme [Arthrobacter sp. zg-Y238]MCQ1953545.1 maleylpyruvate isomerase family mycothiol-dependent enzyme [Arthrobacter sp. zg-Y238]